MKKNSREDRINNAYCFLNSMHSDFRTGLYYKEDLENLEHILSDYKRVLKENEIYKKNSEIMSKENLSTAEQLKVEIKENFRLKNQLENNRKEYQETYKDVREELKELKKENEELLQEKINNQKIIALAQNDMLNYQAGFEDGKNGRTSAVQSIIENQQYYIFQKQIEKYERHIEKLQKENEELKVELERQKDINTIINQKGIDKNYEKALEKSMLKFLKTNMAKDFVSVQKVKDKIEELKQKKKKYGNCLIKMYEDELVNRDIKILQELLEGRK